MANTRQLHNASAFDPDLLTEMLEISDLTLARSGRVIVPHLTLTIGTGITVLAGENGSGKSTLMAALATLLKPISGSISFNGMAYSDKSIDGIRENIGFLDQFSCFPPSFTVLESLQYSCWLRKVPREHWKDASNRAANLANVTDFLEQKFGRLSGGMARRAALANSIVHNPRLVLLDEPAAGLDPVQQELLDVSILEMAKTSSVVVSTHSIDEIVRLRGDFAILSDGELAHFTGRKENNLSPQEIKELFGGAIWK